MTWKGAGSCAAWLAASQTWDWERSLHQPVFRASCALQEVGLLWLSEPPKAAALQDSQGSIRMSVAVSSSALECVSIAPTLKC